MTLNQEIPHIIKYMGSKRNILDFVVSAIEEIDPGGSRRLYDVFAGSSVVSGAFRNIRPVTCNDIQTYSGVIGSIYLSNYYWDEVNDDIIELFIRRVDEQIKVINEELSPFLIDYHKVNITLNEVLDQEEIHRAFINREFPNFDHVFIQRFSGTYWSLSQCIEIDSIITVIRNDERFSAPFFVNLVQGALMFAMAYCTQSTGHYAQYRIVTTDNLSDILIYRRKSIMDLFYRKIYSLTEFFDGRNNSDFKHETTSMDFLDSILSAEKGSLIYADPPYQFVHYSRFYHALETLVRYDYPEVKYKGRYRTDRHQSPFCIRTKVKDAFKSMFEAVVKRKCALVLSYSDNGMISLDELMSCAKSISSEYSVDLKKMDYMHSTMGRQGDKSRAVKEILIIFKPE